VGRGNQHILDSVTVIKFAVNGCNMPMSITGRHGGSYRKHNPQISQTIESLKLICQQLNESPNKWWMSPSVMTSIEHALMERRQKNSQDDDDSTTDNDCEKFGEHIGSDTYHDQYEDIVLRGVHSKRYRKADSGRFATTTNDHDDVASIDSDDSLWNRGRKRKEEPQR
jgi:hypothetical protein